MKETITDFITAVGSIGTFIGVLIATIRMIKSANETKFKIEKLYGKEADERYDALLKRVLERSPDAFGPDEYKGGNKATPQFEVERFYFDPIIMPPEWKKYTRTVRFFNEEGGATTVEGWRF